MSVAEVPMQAVERRSLLSFHGWLSVTYAATILVSAFLLFQVQPLISKFILPWFGGSPAVWTTCMLFFQVVLFAGYSYAHFSEHALSRRAQLLVHLALLTIAIALVPIAPHDSWKPVDSLHPTGRILALLAVSVGLPYFVLSSTGPLVQAWFSRTFPGRSPYRLYSLSNFGSLIALLSYPFVFEPRWTVESQARLWAMGFIAFALCCGAGALGVWRFGQSPAESSESVREESVEARPTWLRRLAWIALPAFGSLMLLATTNHVCQDVAVIPFLWVVPLSLYLLTFIICFDHERWYHRGFVSAATAVVVLAVGVLYRLPFDVPFVAELALHFGALFGICMLCHGELVRLRPGPRHLTAFYLMISAGGALGGIAVSLVAPAVFDSFFEWTIGLVVGYLLAVGLMIVALRNSDIVRRWPASVPAIVVAGTAGLLWVLNAQAESGQPLVDESRNFYGEVSVVERAADDPEQHDLALYSGSILHGVQFVAEEKQSLPTAYYGTESGIGRLLTNSAGGQTMRVGTIGLGVGTLAAYARPGDTYRFYEINPEMVRVARTHFSYLGDCRGSTEVVLGDARLCLEREAPQRFDVLVLDAFSGDSVPAHLLTREAFETYVRHLVPDGVIAVNITNTYLDLAPVVRGAGEALGLANVIIQSDGDSDRALQRARWMLLSANPARLEMLRDIAEPAPRNPRSLLWTDRYSNLFQILK